MEHTPPRALLRLCWLWIWVLAAVPQGDAAAMRGTQTTGGFHVSRREPPFSKEALCEQDFKGYNKALKLISVLPPPTPAPSDNNSSTVKYPRIFCYVNTISPYHQTKAQLVADTWAQRCDKTVFFSNDTGVIVVNKGTSREVSFPVIKMNAPADHQHLWMKHKEVIRYIYDHYRHDYDWIYKADDDAYVVVDNLRAYLRRPEIVNNYKRQPMHLGKRMNLTSRRANRFITNKEMRRRYWSQSDRWVFNSGGPGYAMNRLFIDKFVASMEDKTCLSESKTSPDDTAISFCMRWHDVEPWDTRDLNGRPRWHAFHPGLAYSAGPVDDGEKKPWYQEYDEHIGGYKWGEDCCAPDSIGFHYVKTGGMHHVERMLYFCRTGDDVPTVEAFNAKFGLSVSQRIAEYPYRVVPSKRSG